MKDLQRAPSVRGGLLAAAAALLGGCVAAGRPLPVVAPEANATLESGGGFVVVGDELEVRIPANTDWTHTTRVRPDGKASFLFAGDLEVAGLTPDAIVKKLAEAYRAQLQKPEVTVLLHTPAARTVIVMGEVRRAGEISITDGRLTLLEAIGKAGGPLKDSARLESTLLVRWLPRERRQVSWKIDASDGYWGSPVPLFLQPYDVVFVPNTAIDRENIFISKYINQAIPFVGAFRPVATSSVATVP